MAAYKVEEHMPRTEENWRDHVSNELRKVAVEFKIGEGRMDSFEENLRINTEITSEMHKDTGELLEIFKAMKGGMKVLGWLGSGLKWAVGVGVALASLWAIYSGNPPR